MSHWAKQYLGQAWEAKTHDCWVFFRRVQREQFSREIPAVEVASYRASVKAALLEQHPHRLAWVEITRGELQDGDGVRLANASNPGHVGVWAAANGGCVIHCDQPWGVMATSLEALAETYSSIRFYRFIGNPCQP